MGRRASSRTQCGMCEQSFLSRKARRRHQVLVHKVGTYPRGPKKGKVTDGKRTKE